MDPLVNPGPAQGLANMTESWAMADAQARRHGNAQYVAGWNDAMAENRKLKENFMKLKEMYAELEADYERRRRLSVILFCQEEAVIAKKLELALHNEDILLQALKEANIDIPNNLFKVKANFSDVDHEAYAQNYYKKLLKGRNTITDKLSAAEITLKDATNELSSIIQKKDFVASQFNARSKPLLKQNGSYQREITNYSKYISAEVQTRFRVFNRFELGKKAFESKELAEQYRKECIERSEDLENLIKVNKEQIKQINNERDTALEPHENLLTAALERKQIAEKKYQTLESSLGAYNEHIWYFIDHKN
jgi:dsDNA-binding SOS-regulon protein